MSSYPRGPRQPPPVAYIAAMLTGTAAVLGGIVIACGFDAGLVVSIAAAAVPVLLVLVLGTAALADLRHRSSRCDRCRAEAGVEDTGQ